MDRLKNKKIAIIIMATLIVVSTLLGSNKSLVKLQSKVCGVFYNEGGEEFSIQHDLNDRIDVSGYLVKIAEKYMPSDSQYIKSVETARNALKAADAISDKSMANYQLNSAVLALYDELGSYELSDKDAVYRRNLYATFDSCNDTIGNSSYNNKVREFNSILDRFPANILSRLTSVHKLSTF